MSERRRGLGRGLGALIPPAPVSGQDGARPLDVFFRDERTAGNRDETSSKGDEGGIGSGAAWRQGAENDRALPHPAPHHMHPDPAASTAGAGVSDSGQSESANGSEVTGAQGNSSLGRPALSPDGGPDDSGADADIPSAPQASELPDSDLPATELPVPESPSAPAAAADGLVPVPGAHFAELPIGAIRPNPRQPRTVFDEDELDELTLSVREIGILQPVVVRPTTDGYELVMGERRWRAAGAAGLDRVPAIVRETEDDDLLRDALLENLHRSQLNALEEAAAYQQLLDDFSCTQEELATRIGRSRPQISNTLRLLRLPPLVQRRVAAGVLSAGHARALLGLADGGAMERLAQRIVAEGLSVRSVEEIVALGDHEDREPRSRTRAFPQSRPELVEIESRLSDFLDTRAKVAMGARKGRVTIEFATLEDLGRILTAMGVDPADHLPGEA